MDAEAALAKNLDDADAWRVFADALQAQGDPRGELCALELDEDERGVEPARQQRIEQLRAERRATWKPPAIPSRDEPVEPGRFSPLDGALDALSAANHLEARWRGGFIEEAAITEAWNPKLPSGAETLQMLLAAPAGRFLRALRLDREVPGNVPMGELGERGAIEWALGALEPRPSLQRLTVGPRSHDWFHLDELSNSMVTSAAPRTRGARISRPRHWVGELKPLLDAFPGVTELVVTGEGISVAALPPSLERLEVRTRFLRRTSVEAIARASLPRLRSLRVWLGNWPDSCPDFEPPEPELFYGPRVGAESLAALWTNPSLSQLKHLELSNCAWGAELLPELLRAPLLKQLETLDLSYGFLDETGVEALIAGARFVSHLRRLDLRRNRVFAPSAQRRLKEALGPALSFEPQDRLEGSSVLRLFAY